jgi:uncharacterized protein involved in exopolysaccharide biosynthesis
VRNVGTDIVADDELSLRDIGRVIFAGRRLVIVSTIVSSVACAMWALLSTTIYRSSAVLVAVKIDSRAGAISPSTLGQIGSLASLAGLSLEPRDSRLEEAIAVLQSRAFIEQFIADHKLMPALFPRKWDAQAQHWAVSESRIPTPWKGYRYFIKKILTVERDKKTGLVTISVDWKNRTDAADWANEIVDRVNNEMRSRALNEATLATRYLEQEREQAQYVETRQAIDRLMETEIRQKMLASITKEYVFRTVDRALPADIDDVWRPKRILLALLGVFGGALMGSVIVLVRFSYRSAS